MMKPLAIAFGLAALATTIAYADPKNDERGQHYELGDGTSFSNAGAMFQHLRDRDNGLAAGNPKDIVDAYPDEFDNVGDLIHQKRVD